MTSFHSDSPHCQRSPYLLLTTLIDPYSPLEEGDLIAFCWIKRDGSLSDVLFHRWWGPTGRGDHGRFVTKGSPEEYYDLDGLKYRVKDLAPNRANAPNSLKILGRVMAAKDLGERLTPAK